MFSCCLHLCAFHTPHVLSDLGVVLFAKLKIPQKPPLRRTSRFLVPANTCFLPAQSLGMPNQTEVPGPWGGGFSQIRALLNGSEIA